MQITPQYWKSGTELVINDDDLLARGWECEYETPIFDTDHHNTAPLDPPEIEVRSGSPFKETWNPQEDLTRLLPRNFAFSGRIM